MQTFFTILVILGVLTAAFSLASLLDSVKEPSRVARFLGLVNEDDDL